MSEYKYEFNPTWLWALPMDQRLEIVAWLVGYGITVEYCQSFRYDGSKVTCAMYAIKDGKPYLQDGEPALEEDITFKPKTVPYAIEHTPPMHY